MVDGVAATDLMSVMFSDTVDPAARREFAPGPEPSGAEILARTVARLANPGGVLGVIRRALAAPRPRRCAWGRTLRGRSPPPLQHAPGRLLLADRRDRPAPPLELGHARLSDVKTIRAELGGTVNDVVLAAITNGFRELLLGRGEELADDRLVRTMVPVSVRGRGEHGVYNNRVSAVFASSPSASRTRCCACSASAPKWTA